CRGLHYVGRDRAGHAAVPERLDPLADDFQVIGVGRPGIGAAGRKRVVAEVAAGGRARPEIFGIGEGLAYQGRAGFATVLVGDEAPLGLLRKGNRSNSGDHGGVDAAADDGEGDEEQNSGLYVFHGLTPLFSSDRSDLSDLSDRSDLNHTTIPSTRSMALIPK